MLEYVLNYLDISDPEYWKDFDDYTHTGYVKINFGVLDELNCYGNIVFRGYGSSSALGSEQDAAGAALKEIEKKFEVIIVDFNHDDRVGAEKEHKSIVGLLKKMFELADNVKFQCPDMLDTINSTCQAYGGGPEKFSPSPLSNDQVCALNFYAQGFFSPILLKK